MSAPLQQQQPQQNVVHQPPPQQQHQQQQPIPNTTIDFIALLQSGYWTLYPHNKESNEAAVKSKYNILLNCLTAKKWKTLKLRHSGEDMLVSPKYAPPDFIDYADQAAAAVDDFAFENLVEGKDYVNPRNYGHHKSDKTLDNYNELYLENVIGTETGRRFIQQYLPTTAQLTTPIGVNQVQVDNSKDLVDNHFNNLMGSMKSLSIGTGTTPQQIDDALSISKSVQERLEILKNRHLELEKKKRPLDLVPQNELVADDNTHEKKQRTQVPSTSAGPIEEDIDNDSEDNSQEMELEFENTPGSNTSVKVTFTLQDDTTISATAVTDAAVRFDAAAATTTNQQPNPSPTNNNLSNQPLLDYELANNDDELELTFATQAEKKSHLDKLKLERLAPAMIQRKAIETGDKTRHITEHIRIMYRAGYDNVTNETKNGIANKYSQLPILGKESTSTPEELQLASICNNTAQDIKKTYPGYTGTLLPEAELHLLARVSKGTEGHNNGESQEVSMLAVANRLKDEDYFGLPVVLHQKLMLALGYYRHLPEKNDALMETIIAILYSKYKKIIIMINDTLRAFFESVHYCYFLGVVKALNPNKEIEIISCANGLVPTIGLPYIIEAIHTSEMKHRATQSETSRFSAGANVPFDNEESRKYQNEIIIDAEEFYDECVKNGALPSWITEGRKRVVEELLDVPQVRKDFKDTVKKLEVKLRKLNQTEPSLHNISITSGGSIIIDGGSTDVFGPESEIGSNDIAVVLRTTTTRKDKDEDDNEEEDIIEEVDNEADDIAAGIERDETKVFVGGLPIGQLAPIIAHIQKRNLLVNGARLWIFFDRGCARTNLCNKEFSKLLSKLQKRQFRYVFMSTLNRINWNSVAVQTFLGAQKVSPGLEIHCSLEHGKSKITTAGNEHHRIMEKQESNNICKASVSRIEQSFPEVTLNVTLHNDVKTTSGYKLTKVFRKKVDGIISGATYPPSSFIQFSTLDEQVQKHLEILNVPLHKRLEEGRVAAQTAQNERLELEKKAAEKRRLMLEQAVKQGTLVLITSDSTTGYKGVTTGLLRDRDTGAVTVVYKAIYKGTYLGQFNRKEDAAMEYALAHFNATK